ncbi:sorbitol utilization protein SOU2 [Trichoderma reesei RUT C-30]|uniref:Sorbitol utilization protein SOU2 n=1 Tax=Hypocrea jecorina (strain ATCC 56765 / BCRC 32924 / NRRL 11460 / Rut C-30) TaxID=1344414 RepID=A0A024RX12_HYPJR|nr:sorbitol utilization protein SOU2 [Trichoderma reesei RUT C-30]
MAEGIEHGVFRRNNTLPPANNGVMSLFSLIGKTAIISGAGGGIGLAAARAFAEAGANVAIWYNRNSEAIEKAATIERLYNVKCRAYKVDVTSHEEVDAAVDKVIGEFNGRLDIFVANSGTSWGDEAFIDADIGRYHNLMKINTDGVVYCARAAGRHFRRQKLQGTTSDGAKLTNFTSGSFIATASMSGHIVNIPRRQAAYNASKAHVIQLCKSLAIEWLGFARVNSVSPGFVKRLLFVNTGLSGAVAEETMNSIKDKIPMGRFAETVEMQGIYLYLASDASSYATGADFIVDGGYTAP